MRKTLLPALFIITIALTNCNPCNADLENLASSSLVIYIFNTDTNDYLYPEKADSSIFKKDSLQVYNENGRRFTGVSFFEDSDPRNRLRRFFTVKISPAFIIPDDNDAFEREKTRSIYLKYNYNTTDTLKLVFKARRLKCNSSQYEYLKIYYRNQLVSESEVFTLNRNA